MSRPASWQSCLALAFLVAIPSASGLGTARAGEDQRTARRFLDGLREKGFHDLALEFIDRMRRDPGLPADEKAVLDYEEGRTQIDEASRAVDLNQRRDLLQQAGANLEKFARAQPGHPLAREALVQAARALHERGYTATLFADDAQTPAQKAARQAEARTAYQQARDAYGKAVESLTAAYRTYAVSLPKGDPRLEQRDKIYAAMLDATLQKAISEYELAQAFPPNSAERKATLDEARKQFDDIHKTYRTQMAGIAAQMYIGKCYEEQGKIGEAIGIYKQILENAAPELIPLQRVVGHFYIVALGKRKQHALAADEALRWLQTFQRREERRSREGLGVLTELARNLDASMNAETPAAERQQNARKIVEATSQVVRFASPYKNDALDLLRRYKPGAALRAQDIVRMTYDVAIQQADEAIAAREWDRAIPLLKAAIIKADPRRDPSKANRARYNLAFAYYMNKQYYEADVLAEHLTRFYPRYELSGKAAELGMQALAEAYNANMQVDRAAELEPLLDLARYAAETYPDREEGDEARLNLGLIHQGRGQYDQAIADYAGVREKSPRRLEAQTRLGGTHWALSRALERRGDRAKAEAEAGEAITLLKKTLEARRAAGAALNEAGLVGNAADLAVALTETGKPTDALAVLEPLASGPEAKAGAAFGRLMEALLLARITSGQVEPAIASMRQLEEAGGTNAGRAQLYFKLGQLLQRELDQLRGRGDAAAAGAMEKSYRSFLTALTESKSGLTYESLQWAGESLLALGDAAQAEKVLRRVLNDLINDKDVVTQPGGKFRVLKTKLKLAHALRVGGKDAPRKFAEAESLVDELLTDPRALEPLVEKGMLLEAEAEAGQGSWQAASKHWQDLAQRLSRSRPRNLAYFDAWYHAAYALSRQKQNAKARQALAGVMRLNPSVGSPEMKARYVEFLDRLK